MTLRKVAALVPGDIVKTGTQATYEVMESRGALGDPCLVLVLRNRSLVTDHLWELRLGFYDMIEVVV